MEVLHDDIEFLSQVGSGSYASVWKAKWNGKGRGIIVAVKRIQLNSLVTPKIKLDVSAEVNIFAKLQHQNICHLYGACFTEHELWLVLEFVEGGNLFDMLHAENPVSWDVRLRLAQQVANGLSALHSIEPQILHRDVKSLNCLVSKDGTILKLSDFGMSKIATIAAKREDVGTARWAAPETFQQPPRWTDKADIYSIGIVFYELASLRIPFEEIEDNLRLIYQVQMCHYRPEIPKDCPQELANLMTQCWDPDAAKRPSISKVLELLGPIVAKHAPITNLPTEKPVIPQQPLIHSNALPQTTFPVLSQPEVFEAVLNGEAYKLREIIEQGNININSTNDLGLLPIHLAAAHNHLMVVRLLIQLGAQVNVSSPSGASPLQLATQHGHHEIVKELLKNGATVNDTNGLPTTLFIAASSGNEAIASDLILAGASVNAVDTSGLTPLHFAAQNGHVKVVQLLLDNGAEVDLQAKNKCTPLFLAAERGHPPVIKKLWKAGASLEIARNDGYTPLGFAAMNKSLEVVEKLIKYGANLEASIQSQSSTALFVAASRGYIDVVKLLLAAGAKVNLPGSSMLHTAATEGIAEVIRVIVEAGHHPDSGSPEHTPLYAAAKAGQVEAASELLLLGANVNGANLGLIPLLVAAENGHTGVVKALLHSSANVELTTKDDHATALFLAAQNGRNEILELLLHAGAKVDATNKLGWTPLIVAAFRGHIDTAHRLYKAGAHVNYKAHNGGTALFYAAETGHTEMVDKLFKFGAETHVTTTEGLTPAMVAARNGHKETEAALVQLGGKFNWHKVVPKWMND